MLFVPFDVPSPCRFSEVISGSNIDCTLFLFDFILMFTIGCPDSPVECPVTFRLISFVGWLTRKISSNSFDTRNSKQSFSGEQRKPKCFDYCARFLQRYFLVFPQVTRNLINKTRTSKVDAISEAQKARNIFMGENWKKISEKCHIVPKNVKGGPFWIYKHTFCSKVSKNSKGALWGN